MNYQGYLDDSGVLVTLHDRDPGDSLFFTAHWLFCLRFWGWKYGLSIVEYWPVEKIFQFDVAERLALFEHPERDGLWRRHNTGWSADWDRLSRDQLTPLLCCLSVWKLDSMIRDIFWRHIRRGFFCWNVRRNGTTKENHGEVYRPDGTRRNYTWKLPDFCGPEIWGLYIRGLRINWLRPLLPLLDLETLVSACWLRFVARKETDTANHVIISIHAVEVYPTWVSRLTNRVNGLHDYRQRQQDYWQAPMKGRPDFLYNMYGPIETKNFRI